MTYRCGLCDKVLTSSGEEHECRNFQEAFWSDFRPTRWIKCSGCGRMFNADTELEEYQTHDEEEMCSVSHCEEPASATSITVWL